LHEVAQLLIDALALAGVVVGGDRAGLMAKFEAEESVFQFVEAAVYGSFNVCDGSRASRRGGSL
jgi:hypothetical protein